MSEFSWESLSEGDRLEYIRENSSGPFFTTGWGYTVTKVEASRGFCVNNNSGYATFIYFQNAHRIFRPVPQAPQAPKTQLSIKDVQVGVGLEYIGETDYWFTKGNIYAVLNMYHNLASVQITIERGREALISEQYLQECFKISEPQTPKMQLNVSDFQIGTELEYIGTDDMEFKLGNSYKVCGWDEGSCVNIQGESGIRYWVPWDDLVDKFKLPETRTESAQQGIPDCGCSFIGGMHNVDCHTNWSEKMSLDQQITEAMKKRREVPAYVREKKERSNG